MAEVITETIGCDLGDQLSELFILLPTGEVQRPEAAKTTRQGFTKVFTRPDPP